MEDKLQQQALKRAKDKKRIQQIKNSYKEIEGSAALKDLLEHLDEESDNLMRDVKNRWTVVNGNLVPLDDGMVLSLLYKAAGLEMAREYIKNKLK